jgi:hypothetical protein
MDGATLVQRWLCQRATMPDGQAGVLWRGVAYPLLSDDRIDVGVPPSSEPVSRHAVLPGDEASWVLVQGMPAELDAARKALERHGISVLRAGRWLGDPVGEIAFDWFLRCEGRLDEQQVARLLGEAAPASSEAGTAARLAVLEQRIANLLADLAQAENRLSRSIERPRPADIQPPLPAVSIPSESDTALEDALAEIQALRASLEALGNDRPPEPRPKLDLPQATRTRDEVTALLGALRPDVILVRDSLIVALGELHSRSGFYKAIGELPPSGSRPEGWKMLRGAERWWERHVTTGRNDHGRAYARYDTASRQWSLLLGWKVDQPQDIAWLKRQA